MGSVLLMNNTMLFMKPPFLFPFLKYCVFFGALKSCILGVGVWKVIGLPCFIFGRLSVSHRLTSSFQASAFGCTLWEET